MKRIASHAARLLLPAWCGPALAALPTVATQPPPASTGAGLLQAGFGMVLVIGLIFLLAWLARRFGLQRLGGAGVVKVVSSAPLGTRERVVVVEVAGTWLVLGVTPTQVNALHTLPAQAAPAPAAPGGEPAGRLLEQFSSKLREALGGRAPSP